MRTPKVTIETLRELLAYDPLTGALWWRVGRRCRGAPVAGVPAGHLHTPSGYWVIRVVGEQLRAHRIAWAITHGRWPVNQLDHIDRDRTNNRLSNLREVTPAENQQNMAAEKSSVTGVIGIGFSPGRQNPWLASIVLDSKRKFLGNFPDPQSAIEARVSAEKSMFTKSPNRDIGEMVNRALLSVYAKYGDSVELIGRARKKRAA